MDDQLSRIVTDLVGRLTGPLTLRLYLQPGMAMLFAIRDGLKDARAQRPPFLWTVFTSREDRRALIRDGWKSIGRVYVLAFVLASWRRIWNERKCPANRRRRVASLP